MSIAIVGTLDTKGEEIEFVRDSIISHGVDVHLVDTGVMGTDGIEPNTAAAEVAEAAGTTLETLRSEKDRGKAIEAMGEGAAIIVAQLYEEGLIDGICGLGGSGNTYIATTAMQALPIGVPKLMVSTMASGNTEPYVGTRDVMMMYSVADVEGLNQVTRQVLSNAASAMVGMTQNTLECTPDDTLTIGITMFGVTTPCVQVARKYLEECGYETIVFHATGTGGKAMEQLIEEGIIDGVLDVTTTEWADEFVGGLQGAGSKRLDGAAKHGIPQVVSTGALDMVNFGPMDSVPDEFRKRKLYAHNPHVTLMRTTPQECAALGKIIGKKISKSSGPTALALPLGGISMISVKGEEFYDPDADRELFDALRQNIDEHITLIESDAYINDEAFALTIAKQLHSYMQEVYSDD